MITLSYDDVAEWAAYMARNARAHDAYLNTYWTGCTKCGVTRDAHSGRRRDPASHGHRYYRPST